MSWMSTQLNLFTSCPKVPPFWHLTLWCSCSSVGSMSHGRGMLTRPSAALSACEVAAVSTAAESPKTSPTSPSRILGMNVHLAGPFVRVWSKDSWSILTNLTSYLLRLCSTLRVGPCQACPYLRGSVSLSHLAVVLLLRIKELVGLLVDST
eukprot:2041122-Amphidinium_carterae.1